MTQIPAKVQRLIDQEAEAVKPLEDAAAAEVEAWLDQLDPATTPATDAADLRHIGQALNALEQAEHGSEDARAALAQAVAQARDAGRSWTLIGMVLGISKQAAQQRFATKP